MTRPIEPRISDHRLDDLVRELLAERAEVVAETAISDDAMVERIATGATGGPIGRGALVLAAALLTTLLLAGALAAGALELPRLVPEPQEIEVPLPAEWTGPIRTDAVTMPSVTLADRRGDGFVWTDGPDVGVAWVDIAAVRTVDYRFLEWRLELHAAPPPARTLDPAERIVEYGVVLDATGDGVADCLISISNDAPNPGDYRVNVTNLTTGTADDRVGAPYGFPIDFSHPDERGADPVVAGSPPTMSFFFLRDAAPCHLEGESLRFYTWASATDNGRVTAWDFAPDASWIVAPGRPDR